MVTNALLILGLDETADEAAIEEAYRHMSRHLNPANFPPRSLAETQADKTMSKVVPAYQWVRDPNNLEKARQDFLEKRKQGVLPDEYKPFLGHICVAAGIISIEDLNDAVSKQQNIDLPLGQILQERKLMSQTELDGLLMGQRLFASPTRPLEPPGDRLLALTIITKDMVKIALIDQRTQWKTLPELLLRRGWVDEQILKILMSQTGQVLPS